MTDEHYKFYTLVFKADVRKVPGNPFDVQTPYGKPVACSLGHVIRDLDRAEERINELEAPSPAHLAGGDK